MAQIFVSHSAKDKELVAFVSQAFASIQVRAVFEEFEAILKGAANAGRIASDIRQSNGVFVLLGKHAEELRHSRDWVAWESGVAASVGEVDRALSVVGPAMTLNLHSRRASRQQRFQQVPRAAVQQ